MIHFSDLLELVRSLYFINEYKLPFFFVIVLLTLMLFEFFLAKWQRPFLLYKNLLKFALVCFSLFVLTIPIVYLFLNKFLDHVESHVGAVSWIVVNGEPLYNPESGDRRYSIFYGPMIYGVYGAFLRVFGPSYFALKLASFSSFLIAILLFYWIRLEYESKRNALFSTSLVLVFLGITYGGFVWVRADIFLILLTTAASFIFWTQKINSVQVRWILMGLIVSLGINMKIHSAAYFFPFFVSLLIKRSWVNLLVLGLSFVIFTALPWFLPQFSVYQFVSLLGIAVKTVDFEGFRNIFLIFLVLSIPVWIPKSRFNFYEKVALLFAGLCISYVASRPGAGPGHFLPFIPIVWASAPKIVVAFEDVLIRALSISVLFVALPTTTHTFESAVVFRKQNLDQEIKTFVSQNVGKKFAVGVSDWDHYYQSFSLVVPVWSGSPHIFDPVVEMDYGFIGRKYTRGYLDRIRNCEIDFWFLPNQGAPWTATNWYTGGSLVSEEFKKVFFESYTEYSVLRWFKVYRCKSLERVEVFDLKD